MSDQKNIVFIHPQVEFFGNRTPFPPLGIGYLGAALKKEGHQVRLIDGLILDSEEYEKQIENIEKDEIVCISTLLIHLKEAKRICKKIKESNPESTIIVGGVGIKTMTKGELFDKFRADYFVKEEGEKILPRLLKNLDQPEELKKIRGILFERDGKPVHTGKNKPIEDLDKIPHPDRELLNVKEYLKIWKENVGSSCADVLTSRGCPFSCSFCSKGYGGEKIRFHSAEYVVNEIENVINKYGPDEIYIVDDLFIVNRKRIIDICEKMKKRGIDIPWGAQARVDTINKEILEKIHEVGCYELNFGVETGSTQIQKSLNKGFSLDQVRKAFELCHEVGIEPGAYFMVGIPGVKRKDIEKTKKLISEIKPSFIVLSYFTPYPGTKMYEKYKEYIGNEDYTNWDDFERSILNYDFDVKPDQEYDELMSHYVNSVAPKAPKVQNWFKEYHFEKYKNS